MNIKSIRAMAGAIGIGLVAAGFASPSLAAQPSTIEIERPAAIGEMQLNGAVPLVRATVAGVAGLFLLDTGSNRTVFSDDFAKTLGLRAIANVTGNDSGGVVVHGSVLLPLSLEPLDGSAPIRIAQPLALDLPPLEALGLDGVVSPQTLVDDGCVVVDFTVSRMRIVNGDVAACNEDQTIETIYFGASLSDDGVERPVVEASVATGTGAARRVRFLLDTGAGLTSLNPGVVAGAPEVGDVDIVGVAGEARSAALVGPVTIAFADHRITLGAVKAERRDTPEGLLGMDALGHMRIVFHTGGMIELGAADAN